MTGRPGGVRRLFGWAAVPDPTTFGRCLRRAGSILVPLLDELLWHLLRARWVEEITVWLDKGFFAERVVRCLQRLEVSYLLKVPNHRRVRRELRPWRRSSRAEGIFEEAATVWTSSGRLWCGRLLSLEGRRPLAEAEGTLALDTHEVTETAHILTAGHTYARSPPGGPTTGGSRRGPHQGAPPALGGPDRRRRPRWQRPPVGAGHRRLPAAPYDRLPGALELVAESHPGSDGNRLSPT